MDHPDLPPHPNSTASNPSSTSSATPSFPTTILIILLINPLFILPLGGAHTPGASTSSLCLIASSVLVGAFPPAAVFKKFGTPGGVSLAGGSIVRTASSRRLRPSSLAEENRGASPTETARMASATASSSFVGSKMMFEPTAMTRRVTGGRSRVALLAGEVSCG